MAEEVLFRGETRENYGESMAVEVTPGRVTIGPKSYAIINITSIQTAARRLPYKSDLPGCGILFLVAGGILLYLVAQKVLDPNPFLGGGGLVLLGFGFFALDAQRRKKRPPLTEYTVIFTTNAGEVPALKTTDAEIAQGLSKAIQQAMEKR